MHSVRKRLRAMVVPLLVALAVWHVISGLTLIWAYPGFNDDISPDKYQRLPANEFAATVFEGDLNETRLPAVATSKAAGPGTTMEVLPIAGDTVRLNLLIQGRVENIVLPADRVRWDPVAGNGAAGTIIMKFDDCNVRVAYRGSGYNYWRFVTLQGSTNFTYEPNHVPAYDPKLDTAASVIERHDTSIVIAYPRDNPMWQRLIK